jgi:hypothetical protein
MVDKISKITPKIIKMTLQTLRMTERNQKNVWQSQEYLMNLKNDSLIVTKIAKLL